MSIDAIIQDVRYLPDGTAELDLGPANDKRAPAGQPCLKVLNPVPHLDALVGSHIWGGSSEIMLGTKKLAERIGYTQIRLC